MTTARLERDRTTTARDERHGRPFVVRAAGTLVRPDVAAGVLIAVEVGGVNDAFGAPVPGLPSLHLLSLAYAGGVLVLGLLQRRIRPVWTPLFAFWLLYAVARGVAAVVTSLPSGPTLGPFVADVRSLVFLVVCTTLLCALRRPRRMVVVATVAVAAGAVAAVVQEFALGNATELFGFSGLASVVDAGGATVRHTGPQPDANFWGRTLVLFAPLAFALAASTRSARGRTLWIATAVAFAAGVWLSGSRAAMLAFGFAVVAWLALGGARRARLLVLAPVALVAVLALPGVGSRLATLTDGATLDDPSLQGRVAAQTTAVTLALEHPVFGVGTGKFTEAAPEVLRRTGARTDRVLAPHNLYLEVASETGAAGVLTWLLCFGAMLTIALRGYLTGRRRLPDGVDDADTLVAGALVVGLTAWALCSVTLHMANVRFLLVAAAFAVAFDRRIAARAAAAAPQRTVAPTSMRRPTAAVAAVTVGSAVAACVVAVMASTAAPRWSAVAAVAVVPRDADAGPYEYDLLSRGTVVASVTELLRSPGPAYRAALPDDVTLTVRRSARPERSSVLSVVATGPDRRDVARVAPAVVARVATWIDGLGTIYTARPVATGVTGPVRAPVDPTPPLAAGLLAGCVAGLGTGFALRRRQRPVGTASGAAHSRRVSRDAGPTGSGTATSCAVGRHDSRRTAPTRFPAP